MRSKKITSITLDPNLLAEIDAFAEAMAATRSWAIAALVRAALASRPDGAVASPPTDRSP